VNTANRRGERERERTDIIIDDEEEEGRRKEGAGGRERIMGGIWKGRKSMVQKFLFSFLFFFFTLYPTSF
jgi:hypothetical protein